VVQCIAKPNRGRRLALWTMRAGQRGRAADQ
jgi:hypothetical protein